MIKKVNESVDIIPEHKEAHDKLIAAGFRRNSVSSYGGTVKPEDMSYSFDDEDILIEVEREGEGYTAVIVGDGEDNFCQATEVSLSNVIKIKNLAVEFFSKYPSTRKFIDKFADEYGLDKF